MLDWKGQLSESTGAHVFLAIDGALVTPRIENILDGITRREVIGMAHRRGIAVEERAVMPDELARASELFFCGSAAEIVPVASVDSLNFQVGPITRAMLDDFPRLVRTSDCEGFGESGHWAA